MWQQPAQREAVGESNTKPACGPRSADQPPGVTERRGCQGPQQERDQLLQQDWRARLLRRARGRVPAAAPALLANSRTHTKTHVTQRQAATATAVAVHSHEQAAALKDALLAHTSPATVPAPTVSPPACTAYGHTIPTSHNCQLTTSQHTAGLASTCAGPLFSWQHTPTKGERAAAAPGGWSQGWSPTPLDCLYRCPSPRLITLCLWSISTTRALPAPSTSRTPN